VFEVVTEQKMKGTEHKKLKLVDERDDGSCRCSKKWMHGKLSGLAITWITDKSGMSHQVNKFDDHRPQNNQTLSSNKLNKEEQWEKLYLT
jgi:hypothetical protein